MQETTLLSSELVGSVLESAPDAMLIVDASGSILFANRQASKLFGYGGEEILGRSVESLLPQSFRELHVAHRQRYMKDGQVRPMGIGLDLHALRKDGAEIPVEISLSPIRDGGRTLVAAAIRDITDRKLIEKEIIAAREDAVRANQAKSRFLATASHDLRQPLQTLSLLNGALQRMAQDAHAREILSQQEHAIGAMSRLLNALLDISKLESGALRPEISDVTVAELFEGMRREFDDIARSKGLQLTIEPCRDQVRTDPSLVSQMLRNLVSNAIRYTPRGGVTLRCLHEQARVRIEVLDSGIGIRGDQLPHIFDEFYQAGVAANAAREGYGLGLSIVKRIVNLLDLRLDVQSEYGKGSKFSFELPASGGMTDVRAAPSMPATGVGRNASKPHILIVEDDEAVRRATLVLLRVSGYRVSAVGSLQEAVRLAEAHGDISLLVTDYHLEDGEDGMQVITSLRAILGPGLKTLLLTGDTSSTMRHLEHDGRLHVMSKPMNSRRFLELIDSLLAA